MKQSTLTIIPEGNYYVIQDLTLQVPQMQSLDRYCGVIKLKLNQCLQSQICSYNDSDYFRVFVCSLSRRCTLSVAICFFFPQTKYLDKRLMEKFLHQLLILLRTHCPDSRSEGLLKPQSNRFGVTLSKNRQHGGVRCQSSLAMIYCVQTCSSKVDCFNITGTMLIGSKGSKRRDLRVNCRLLSNGPDLPSRIKRLQCSRLDLRNNRIALDTQKKKNPN